MAYCCTLSIEDPSLDNAKNEPKGEPIRGVTEQYFPPIFTFLEAKRWQTILQTLHAIAFESQVRVDVFSLSTCNDISWLTLLVWQLLRQVYHHLRQKLRCRPP